MLTTPGHGDGSAILQAAAGHYVGVKNELENKPSEELERTVKELSPIVNLEDINTWGGLGLSFGVGILAGILSETIPQAREITQNIMMYSFLPSLAISIGYIFYTGTGERLTRRYTRDAVQSILRERQ